MRALSKRLFTIADFVPYGAYVCDVGTDHALLPVFLSKSGRAKGVIATDINEKPLEAARKNIVRDKAENIKLRLCDGLAAVTKGEADTIIIAGMGGEVISGIISRCGWIKDSGITLILQPMTSGEILRKFLFDNGFEITSEKAVFENGKVYSVILSRYTGRTFRAPDYYYFIGKTDPADKYGLRYIKKQLSRCEDCASALYGIAGKEDEYAYYKNAAEGISTYINGAKTEQ